MCPKNSLEAISLGMAPQSTAIKGLLRRSLFRCISFATTSLPVPLSPIISTDISVGATKLINLLSFLDAGLTPSIYGFSSVTLGAFTIFAGLLWSVLLKGAAVSTVSGLGVENTVFWAFFITLSTSSC